ncbi:MAG: 50S ribosomal protein L18 [Eubacteriales bacterium]|jgi:large subunit ribosomal protein L18|nr:50S ribosomal protein L18 [Eubacteriales bacterium]
MIKKAGSNVARKRRHLRVRKKIHGTANLPRLNVFRSLKNIYAQIIDDDKGVTIAAASSLDASLKDTYGGNKEAARAVGKLIAEKASKAGITEVVFDRGGYLYHGRVKELAEGAREGGLKF